MVVAEETSHNLVTAFSPCIVASTRSCTSLSSSRLFSSIGGDDDDDYPPPEDEGNGELDDFLNPKQESTNLQRAREFLA